MLQACGLGNFGSTCYLNTIIQQLFFDPNFIGFLNQHIQSTNPLITSFFDLADAYSARDRSRVNTTLRAFLTQVSKDVRSIHVYEQNDIQEVLTILIDKIVMGSTIPYVPPKPFKGLNEVSVIRFMNRMDAEWKNYHQKIYSPLTPIYHGQLVRQLKCTCGHVVHTVEVFTTLILEGKSVEEGLRSFEKDLIHGWSCEKCKKVHDQIEMVNRITRFPKTLIICFKDKSQKSVPGTFTFPCHLHMLPAIYTCQLMSVGCHVGQSQCGHYFALVRGARGWLQVDDDMVTEASEAKSARSSPYVLFYNVANQ